MYKPYLVIALLIILCGCVDADTKVEMQNELRADLESFVKAEVKSQVRVTGIDMRQKIADDLEAEINSKIETHTQNTGMFSGGAIYVVAVAVAFFAFVFGTFIWLVKSLIEWKQIWHLISASIESNSKDANHAEHVKKIKSEFSDSLEKTGLKSVVDKNLIKRGMKNSSRR